MVVAHVTWVYKVFAHSMGMSKSNNELGQNNIIWLAFAMNNVDQVSKLLVMRCNESMSKLEEVVFLSLVII